MLLNIFKSKIHRATITHANVAYEGSITIDKTLMEAANILPYEAIHVWNVNSGTRLITYVIEGPSNSGIICINGAAAHLNKPGEIVILATFINILPEEAKNYKPIVIKVDCNNKMIQQFEEVPGPYM